MCTRQPKPKNNSILLFSFWDILWTYPASKSGFLGNQALPLSPWNILSNWKLPWGHLKAIRYCRQKFFFPGPVFYLGYVWASFNSQKHFCFTFFSDSRWETVLLSSPNTQSIWTCYFFFHIYLIMGDSVLCLSIVKIAIHTSNILFWISLPKVKISSSAFSAF